MPNGDSGGFDFGSLADALLGELGAAIGAILQFLADLVAAIARALNVLFAGQQSIFGFSFAGLSDVWGGLKKILDHLLHDVILASLAKLYDFYKRILAWAKKLKAWLDKLHALQKKYEMAYFRKLIQILSRARKILTIFRFFHLKFAQRLDNWLATVEGRAARYQILLVKQLNLVTSWVNLIVDPRGALRTFPLVAGIIAALNVTWSGIFGVPFQGAGGAGGNTPASTSVSVTFPQTAADAKSSSGTAAVLHANYASQQTEWNAAAGL